MPTVHEHFSIDGSVSCPNLQGYDRPVRLFSIERFLMSADARIIELQLELPPAPKPGGIYHPVLILGNTAIVSGHGPVRLDGTMITGKVGDTMSESDAHQAARQVGLTMLSTLRRELGSAALIPV